MRVLCVEGHEGVLEEGGVYSVREITGGGNYILWEVQPPSPYLSFKSDRFVLLNDELLEEELAVEWENHGGD